MSDHVIPAGPVPIFCAWFDADGIDEWTSREEAKESVHVSPVIAWVYKLDSNLPPVPITAFDGKVGAPEKIRHLGYSYDEAKMHGEVMAMGRYTTFTALRKDTPLRSVD